MYKYTVEKKLINGISVVEYRPAKKSENIVFYMHGHMDSKEGHGTYYTSYLARLGYTVVAFDAYGHGERKTDQITFEENEKGLMDFVTIIQVTAKDLISLYQNHYSKEFKKVTLVGLSMGGMIVLLSQVFAPIFNTIVSLVSTPDFYNFGKSYVIKNHNYEEKDLEKLKGLHQMSPSEHLDNFKKVRMLFVVGNNDQRINPRFSKDFVDTMNVSNIEYKNFECGHHLTDDAVDYTMNWIKNNVK